VAVLETRNRALNRVHYVHAGKCLGGPERRLVPAADADAHWHWNNDPEVVRWMSTGYEKLVLGIEIISESRLIGFVALTGAEAENRERGA
jgi:hypothetical protein